MQRDLRALFDGKVVAAVLPAKRGPGRPPKVKREREEREEDDERDEALEALESMVDDHQGFDEHMRPRKPQKRKAFAVRTGERPGSCSECLAEVCQQPFAALRMPGAVERTCAHEGPQVKLRMCEWFRKTLLTIGGTEEMRGVLLGAVAEKWGIARFEVVGILSIEKSGRHDVRNEESQPKA